MVRRLAAAVGLALLVAGCGSHQDRTKPVADYIGKVNTIQQALVVPLGQVTQGYRELSGGKRIDKMQPQFQQSARTIGKLERRIDALDAPPDAARLDRILRELVDQEHQLATEVALLSGYVRDSSPILTRAGTAGQTLHTALRKSKKPKEQAAALQAYATPLDAAANDLAALDAPPVVKPSQQIEVKTYRDVSARARALATALLHHPRSVAQKLHDFEVAVIANSSTASQTARIAAIKSWDKRVAHVRVLENEAQAEREHLQNILQ